jgi:hypothetical protein
MTWSDFLKYSKYVAVFYAAAFLVGIVGIWAQPHSQWIWTAVMFFGAAMAGNVALACYHYNHKGSMLLAKNDYLAAQDEAQVITGTTSKSMELRQAGLRADMEEFMTDKIKEEMRNRGYR